MSKDISIFIDACVSPHLGVSDPEELVRRRAAKQRARCVRKNVSGTVTTVDAFFAAMRNSTRCRNEIAAWDAEQDALLVAMSVELDRADDRADMDAAIDAYREDCLAPTARGETRATQLQRCLDVVNAQMGDQ